MVYNYLKGSLILGVWHGNYYTVHCSSNAMCHFKMHTNGYNSFNEKEKTKESLLLAGQTPQPHAAHFNLSKQDEV